MHKFLLDLRYFLFVTPSLSLSILYPNYPIVMHILYKTLSKFHFILHLYILLLTIHKPFSFLISLRIKRIKMYGKYNEGTNATTSKRFVYMQSELYVFLSMVLLPTKLPTLSIKIVQCRLRLSSIITTYSLKKLDYQLHQSSKMMVVR